MDGLRLFLESVRQHDLAEGNLLGILVIAVGAKIAYEGQVVSEGSTWRELAETLKKVRWNKQQVKELGLKPADLPPRDRCKYWYSAIARADLVSLTARQSAAALGKRLEKFAFSVALPHA